MGIVEWIVLIVLVLLLLGALPPGRIAEVGAMRPAAGSASC
jgi:Sec-independent protein translocase protein TatA